MSKPKDARREHSGVLGGFARKGKYITFVEMAACSVFKYKYLYLLYLPEELQ